MNKFVGDTNYEIEQDINISGNHYIFAVDKSDEYPYMVTDMEINDIFTKYTNTVASDDYIEAMLEWNTRINTALQKAQEKLSQIQEFQVLSNNDVTAINYSDNITGKIVVIKPDVFLREAQFSQNQIMLVNGGFGAEANSRGRTIFCTRISDGSHQKFYRSDVLGVIKPDNTPKWAVDKIAELNNSAIKPTNPISKR